MPEEQHLDELRFSRTQSYFDRSLAVRLLIAAIFALCLFLFFHFREAYVESLDIGKEAKKYVVAQVDFAFPDDEATIILRERMAREIGAIWRIDDGEVRLRITQFQKYVTEEGEKEWSVVSKESGFEDLALALSLLDDALILSRFTDIRTLHKLEEFPKEDLPVPLSSFYIFIPPPERQASKLPSSFWNAFGREVLIANDIPPAIAQYILQFFSQLPWKFERDQGTQYTLRKELQGRIPQKFTQITAGERFIDQGEEVSARHLAILSAMKRKLAEGRNLWDPLTIAGSLLTALLFMGVSATYLRENHRDVFTSNRKLGLLATILLLNLFFAKVVELFLLKNPSSLVDLSRFPLFVPFSAILLSSLMNMRIATFGALFLAVVFAMVLAVEPVPFLVINILAGMVAILGTRAIRRRKEVFVVCGKAWLGSLLVIAAFNLSENTLFSWSILSDLTSTFLFMSLTAVLVVGLLPILESTFQIMTDITLMEFMDPSNELLRRLTVEAPGTYQHSMVVGNLAEAAATAIGANGLFCRVATQYHDVGKLANPQYFTENQLGGVDMHQLLTPFESAQVIVAHVSEGVALARKVGLPEQFIDIIKEHHGTTLVYYFYHKQLEIKGGDKSEVDEKDFRYSGPKPHSKESTIIMIADTLEAASRSLDMFNEKSVTDLVESLIAQKMEDGQFNESLLTFEELRTVKSVLIKTLLAASHPRVKYPPHHPGEEG